MRHWNIKLGTDRLINTFTRDFASASRKSTTPLSRSRTLETPQHWDLASFLAYAKRTGLDETSPTFTGTRYEYLVAERLARYGFSLRRVGGASDFGIDLVGDWTIPSTAKSLRVLVQCKAGSRSKAGPQFIRELDGSFVGAPPGWRGSRVLGLLVTEKQATDGVRDALTKSRSAMAYFCCTGREGVVKQMHWNQRADEEGLEGIDVALRRAGEEEDEIVLVKDGLPLPIVE
ncbi:hypothetical protein MKX08_004068 [Trichoderma sp. CBMAI-0020]|nr:hypothetical protein MKX08_004068 [Trichoderma sp. CBMAI-0020]